VTTPTLSRSTLGFTLFSLVLMAVNYAVIGDLVGYAQANMTGSHILLVPFVTLALLFQDREAIFGSVQPAVRAGLVVVAAGIVLMLAGRYSPGTYEAPGLLSVSAAGVVVTWIGGFLLAFGGTAFRAALFPLLFLVFTVPIPIPIVQVATLWLKTGSAAATASLFSLTGTPYLREGFVFSLPNVVIEVADECSGIRSSIALLLTALLVGHSLLNRGWAKAVIVLAILPLSILKNGIRIASLTLLSIHVDPGFLTGQLHHEGGIVFFLLALGMLAPLVVALRRYETLHNAGT
jgi:exosortase